MSYLKSIFQHVQKSPSLRPKTRKPSYRQTRFESLEPRQMMTTNIYLDFGEGFDYDASLGAHVFEDFKGLFETANHLDDPLAYSEHAGSPEGDPSAPNGMKLSEEQIDYRDKVLEKAPEDLTSSLADAILSRDIDYDGNGWVNQADYDLMADDVAGLVRRAYEPFDVNVQVVASRTPQDVLDHLAGGGQDAYIFVAGRAVTDSGGDPENLGMAWIDDDNQYDNVGFVAMEDYFDKNNWYESGGGSSFRNDLIQLGLGRTAAHEAAHTFGLYHHDTGMSDDQRLLANGDIMFVGPDSSKVGAWEKRDQVLSFATRKIYPAQFDSQSSYDTLADTLGLASYAPAYVTGTGAHDEIRIIGYDNGQAHMTVWSYDEPQEEHFENQGYIDLQVYMIDASNGILVEAGAGNDYVKVIYVDEPVEIRGGKGDDTLIGADGNDRLFGEFGDDRLEGGDGGDFYPFAAPRSWDLGTDTIVDNGGDGDTLDFSDYRHAVSVDLASTNTQLIDRGPFIVSGGRQYDVGIYQWGEEPESQLRLQLLGAGGSTGLENLVGTHFSDRLYGNELDNAINARSGSDQLQGRGGDDLLWGGYGSDYYLFAGSSLGADFIGEYYSWGVDTLNFAGFDHALDLNLSTTATQTVSPGHLSLGFASSWGIDRVYGTRFGDFVRGNGRNNTFYGGDGDDTLLGGNGSDTLHGEEGDDVLYGEDGLDYLYGLAGADYLDGGADRHKDTLDGGRDNDRDTFVQHPGYTDECFANFTRYDEVQEWFYAPWPRR